MNATKEVVRLKARALLAHNTFKCLKRDQEKREDTGQECLDMSCTNSFVSQLLYSIYGIVLTIDTATMSADFVFCLCMLYEVCNQKTSSSKTERSKGE